MKLHTLTKAIALATLLSAASLSAHAAEIPLSGAVEADEVVTKILAVDFTKHRLVLEGAGDQQVHVQFSDKAKDRHNLKVGDQVKVQVIHSVVAMLDTDLSKNAPAASGSSVLIRTPENEANPIDEAYRQAQVQLKITAIDLKKNQLTFEGPAGNKKVVSVEKPEVQARLKDLKVGQSVVVTYTDVLKIISENAS